MKKLILATLVLLFTVVAHAQNKNETPEQKAQRMNEHMKTELSLTDAQYKAVQPINLDFAKRKAEVEKGNHEAHVALKSDYEKQMATILTPEQMEKFKAMHQKNGKKGKGMGKNGPFNKSQN